jgi:N-glycosidase YbiA
MSDTITFYRIHEPYGCFSNFAPYPVEIDGQIWPTTEHYYQAQKFADPAYRERIRLEKHPSAAKGLGNSDKQPIRPDWDAVRVDVMRQAVCAKLAQHPEVAEALLSTGDAVLVEHSAKDPFWTDGGDGSGENTFGRLLMALRAELRYARSSAPLDKRP